MVHQTTLKPGPGATVNGVLGEIGDMGNNLVTLAALQARLAAEDFRESARRSLPGVIAAAVLLPVAFASTTAALFGVAYWLAAAWDVSLGKALLTVAAGGLGLSISLAGFAVSKLRDGSSSFRRSREELERNIAWLGTVLAQSGR